MTYPATPGAKGSGGTSQLAARRFQTKLGRRQAEAYAALEQLGTATSEEIAEHTGRHWYVTRPRLSELAVLGLVADTGERGLGALGGNVIRWRLTTPEERAALAAGRAS